MQVIYVDVLLFFNFCVNYFLLRGTAFLTHTPCRIPRCLPSALLGSFLCTGHPPTAPALGSQPIDSAGNSCRYERGALFRTFSPNHAAANHLVFLLQYALRRLPDVSSAEHQQPPDFSGQSMLLPAAFSSGLYFLHAIGIWSSATLACCPDAMPTHRCSLSGLYSHRLRNSDTNGTGRHRKQLG